MIFVAHCSEADVVSMGEGDRDLIERTGLKEQTLKAEPIQLN
ncbi:hypothetical protein [Oculatella sp. FACHB-28]|nr:hypothetical protein [Oculatella sp. FACHB-28]